MPRVLAATGPFLTFSLEEVFELAGDAGFDGVELMVTGDRISQAPDQLHDLAERYRIPVVVVHGPFLVVTRRVFGSEPRGKLDRSIELARAVGAEILVAHPPYAWQASYAEWFDERAAAAAAEGLRVAAETMYPLWVGERPVRTFRWSDPEDLLGRRFVTVDTSHLAVARRDPLAVLRLLGERVVHVHASNNAGLGRDDHAPLDEGTLDLPAILELVGMLGTAETVTLELDVRRWEHDRAVLLRALRHNLQIAREHLAAGRARAWRG